MSRAPAVEVPATLVEGIARTFRRHGYEGASMKLLSQETKFGRSSLYHYFPTGKIGMALAALDQVERFLCNELGPLMVPGAQGEPGGAAACVLLLDYFENGSLGCLLGAFSLQGCPSEVAERVRRVTEIWIGQFEELFRTCGHDNPRARAENAVGEIQGALIMSAITRDPEPIRRTLINLLGGLV